MDRKTLENIARLAHLEVEEGEIEARLREFNEIVGYVEKLNQLNTEGISPTFQISDEETLLREDTPEPSLDPTESLKNAPARKDSFFVVPRVIKESN